MTDPTGSDIQKLVAYLPRLYGSGLELVRGFDTRGFGSYDYDPVVRRFYRLVSQDCWCDFGYQPAEVERSIQDLEWLSRASIPEIKTVLTYCQRQERFCTGHWKAMIEDGVIRAVLERLKMILRSHDGE
jgi:hypothetical protein